MRRYLIAGIVFAVATNLTASAATSVNQTNEFVVSAISGQLQYPSRLWDDTVAWQTGPGGDVYAKNTVSGEIIEISVGQGGSDYVNIHGQTVVWGEWGGGPPVWAFDLTTRTKSQVTSVGDDPDVHGDLVVWKVPGDTIFVKDMSSGSQRAIPGTGHSSNATCPAISGQVVVWPDGGFLRGYDLATEAAFTVSASGRVGWPPPGIHGNIVVWRDRRNDNMDIYAADISDRDNVIEIPICTNVLEQNSPQVYGNIIVWTEHRNGDQDVYGYDLGSGMEFPIAVGPGNQFSPTVYEDTVMWSHELGGEVSIHGNTIIPEPTALSLLALGGLALVRRRSRRELK